MKLILSSLLIVLTTFVNAQVFYEIDTLRYEDRIDGPIDSIDVNSGNLPTTFDGGVNTIGTQGVSVSNLYENIVSNPFQRTHKFSKVEFSALPHLGFAYSFGAQGTQFIHAKYNHAFTEKLILDVDYVKSSTAGVIRNSASSLNDLGLQLLRAGNKYSTYVKASFNLNTVAHSGGLQNVDSIIEQFGLEFAPVQKGAADSKNKLGIIDWDNYFNLLPDSLRQLGLKTTHKYSVFNRVYNEFSDTLSELYQVINIDSTFTRDQTNLASITNGAGIFFASNNFSIDGVLTHRYWDLQNLGSHIDTTEIGIESSARLNLRGFCLSNELKINLIGAANEFSEEVSVQYNTKKLGFYARYFLKNQLMQPDQRKYLSNHVLYDGNFLKQTATGLKASLRYDFIPEKYNVGLCVDLNSITNPFVFNGTNWVNDSIDFNFASFSIDGGVQLGPLHINPRYIYSVSKNYYLPQSQLFARIFVKGKLFKAKKLEALIGVDASYTSSFRLKSYIPFMDTYDWNNTTTYSNSSTNLHAFIALGISEFRFFIRYENIGYFWSDKLTQELLNYPIAGTRMRVGITWDFFN
ncbi:MAG: putative porin [Crocinitomicaceae bacterium]|nr:putative porin [Crocinitomicaceae bacterium]